MIRRDARACSLFVLAFFGILLVAACADKTRQTTLRAAFAATDAVGEKFVGWDAAHQKAVVDTSTSLEDSKAKLSSYRSGEQAKVRQLFAAAYKAIAAAALADDGKSLDAAKLAAESLGAELVKLMGSP